LMMMVNVEREGLVVYVVRLRKVGLVISVL
jgi:hypothetical protein